MIHITIMSRFRTAFESTRDSWLFLIFFVSLLLPSASALAQYASDVYSAPTLAMGGAAQALGFDGTALAQNPATMALFGRYQIDTLYRLYRPEASHLAGVSFIDDFTSKLASGMSWEGVWAGAIPGPGKTGWTIVGENPAEPLTYRAHTYRLGAAYPINTRIAAGVSGTWRRHKSANSEAIADTQYQSRMTFNVGSVFVLTQALRLGFAGINLIPTQLVDLPTTLVLGAAGNAGPKVLGALDLVLDFTSLRDSNDTVDATSENLCFNFHAGVQVLVGKFIPVRAGVFTDGATGATFVTGGAGLEGGQTRIGYALRYQVDRNAPSDVGSRFYHMISLSLAFQRDQ